VATKDVRLPREWPAGRHRQRLVVKSATAMRQQSLPERSALALLITCSAIWRLQHTLQLRLRPKRGLTGPRAEAGRFRWTMVVRVGLTGKGGRIGHVSTHMNRGSCHKRQKPQAPTPQAPIRNRQTRKVANAKGTNRNTNLT